MIRVTITREHGGVEQRIEVQEDFSHSLGSVVEATQKALSAMGVRARLVEDESPDVAPPDPSLVG